MLIGYQGAFMRKAITMAVDEAMHARVITPTTMMPEIRTVLMVGFGFTFSSIRYLLCGFCYGYQPILTIN